VKSTELKYKCSVCMLYDNKHKLSCPNNVKRPVKINVDVKTTKYESH